MVVRSYALLYTRWNPLPHKDQVDRNERLHRQLEFVRDGGQEFFWKVSTMTAESSDAYMLVTSFATKIFNFLHCSIIVLTCSLSVEEPGDAQ